jgi:hypothetical protein
MDRPHGTKYVIVCRKMLLDFADVLCACEAIVENTDEDLSRSRTVSMPFPFQSLNQAASEDTVCSYIDALIENNFNENGEINIQTERFDFANWKNRSEYSKLGRRINGGQIFMLVLTMSVTATLAGYAFYLNRKLRSRKLSTPPIRFGSYSSAADDRDNARSHAGRLSRLNSGILAMRSRSHEGSPETPYVPYGGSIPEGRRNDDGDDWASVAHSIQSHNSISSTRSGSSAGGRSSDLC